MELLENVLLSDIDPDPNNPRSDFGDLDFLARTFDLNAANPGEPVNPIAVVRDGSRFRIVDGERRYRAMRSRNRVACAAVVYEDYDEYQAVLQMLATNQKMELSPEDISRGFQLSLLLGDADADAEMLAGVERGTAAKVRRARQAVADPNRCRQMTIEQMAAIAEFADDEDAVDAIASATGDSWVAVASKLRRAASHRRALDQLVAAADVAGIELRDERPEGLASIDSFRDADDLSDYAMPEGAVAVLREGDEWNPPCVVVYGESAGDAADSAEAELAAEVEQATEAFQCCMRGHLAQVAASIAAAGFENARSGFKAVFALVLERAVDGKGYDSTGIRELAKRIAAFNEAAGAELDIEWTASLFCSALYAALPDIREYECEYAVLAERGDLEGKLYYMPADITVALQFARAFEEDGFEIPDAERRMYDGWIAFTAAYARKEASE